MSSVASHVGSEPRRSALLGLLGVTVLGVAGLLSGCGGTGPAGPPGPPGTPGGGDTSQILDPTEDAPGVVITITGVAGATGAGGAFQAGDHLTVNYTLKKNDGSSWNLSEMGVGAIMASGPTFNFQRILKEKVNVIGHSIQNADGSYSYTFDDPIPSVYEPPINDSGAYGTVDGNLAGTSLLSGTYTVGMYLGWFYTVDGDSFSDAGNATFDFLYGPGAVLAHREVIGAENCNSCHVTMRMHGGFLRDVKMCSLCHTIGAEDFGTPGVHLWFPEVIHKLHNAEHLPSVNGVATNPNGSRDYAAPPVPYEITNVLQQTHDHSHVAFPVWPNLNIPMPRDAGYSGLTSAQRATEDVIRQGVTDCAKCHGDPDGAGPLDPPAQGGLYTAPSRLACGSCHDDVNWAYSYAANGQTMPAQASNGACAICHPPSGGPLAVDDAHLHPLLNPSVNPGLNFLITNLDEDGLDNNSTTIDPGEKVKIRFRIRDDAGVDVTPNPAQFSTVSAVLSGPTSNYHIVLNTSIPTDAIVAAGGPVYQINVPERLVLEFVGDAGSNLISETFSTVGAPHWDMANALTVVWERTATAGGSTTLATAAPAVQNFIDVASAAGFARGDALVIDDGVPGLEEYLVIQFVSGNRLWFSSPYTTTISGPNPELVSCLRFAHGAAATVQEVTLTQRTAGADYTLNAVLGRVTEAAPASFTAGNAVVVTYTTDFVMPSVFPCPLNESPDLDSTEGEWRALPIVDGTYTFGMWASINRVVTVVGENTTYRGTSPPATIDFGVGSDAGTDHYSLISSPDNCYECHNDIYFHGGGRRGYDTCILCHGTTGAEDRPQYVAENAPATTGTPVTFRTMLHKIHMGEHLSKAATYEVVGFGSSSYPNNFTVATYEHVVFPAMPDWAKDCGDCHGRFNTAWQEPGSRTHPLGQPLPTRSWRVVCSSCHDSDAASAHFNVNTDVFGVEACAICHDQGGLLNVELVHKIR